MKNILIVAILVISISYGYSQDTIDIYSKPEPMAVKEFKFPEHREFVLKNGLKLFIIEDREQPIISLRMHIAGGQSMDRELAGVSSITADMLLKGYGKTSTQEIAQKLDGAGASISASASIDAISINATSLRKHFPMVLDIFKNVIINPSFPKKEFEKLVPQYKAYLQQKKAEPSALANDLARIVLYGENHPYSSRMTEKSLEKIKIDDIKYYHNSFFKPGNSTLAIVGDIEVDAVVKQLQSYFDEWKAQEAPAVQIPPAKPMANGVYFVSRPGSVQSTIIMASPGLPYNHNDYYKLSLAADVIGAGFAGRLFRTLRETYSYTYSPYGYLTSNKYLNNFVCGADVRSSVTDSAIVVIKEQLNMLAIQEAEDAELNRVKRSIIGDYLMSFESSEFIANIIQRAYFYGIPMRDLKRYPDIINSISSFEIKNIASGYMNPYSAYILVVGDPQIKSKLEVFGNIYEYNLDLEPLTGTGAKLEKLKLKSNELLDKYTSALGGNAALNGIETLLITGKTELVVQGNKMEGEVISKHIAPNKMHRVVKFAFREQETISDGKNVWSKNAVDYEKYSGNDSIAGLLDATLFKETKLIELGFKCDILGKQGNQILMQATSPNGIVYTYYFNSETYLIEKYEYIDSFDMLVTERILDYSKVGNVYLPHRRETTTPMLNVKIELKYEINQQIEDTEFRPRGN